MSTARGRRPKLPGAYVVLFLLLILVENLTIFAYTGFRGYSKCLALVQRRNPKKIAQMVVWTTPHKMTTGYRNKFLLVIFQGLLWTLHWPYRNRIRLQILTFLSCLQSVFLVGILRGRHLVLDILGWRHDPCHLGKNHYCRHALWKINQIRGFNLNAKYVIKVKIFLKNQICK